MMFIIRNNCPSLCRRVSAPTIPQDLKDRWGKNIEFSKALFVEASVQVDEIEGDV